MDSDRKRRWKINAKTTALRAKYLGADAVRLLLLGGIVLGALGVFGPYTPLPETITIAQAPAVFNETTKTIGNWGAFTIPLFAFLLWQTL